MTSHQEPRSPTFCKAPYIWKVISPHGEIRPCCAYRGTIGSIYRGGIDNFQFNRLTNNLNTGVQSKGCKECWHREKLGFSSHRLHSKDWVSLPNKMKFLEFNLSNICNLKCRMCNSSSSTTWSKDEKELQIDPEINFRKEYDLKKSYAFPTDRAFMDFLKTNDLTEIQRLTFKGGEPLMHPQVFLATDYFTSKNIFDLQLQFTSSGTIFNSKLAELSNFREVEFTFSVEGTGAVYSYIRGGKRHQLNDLNKLIEFLKNISNFKIISNSCISAYSYFNISDLYIWLLENIPNNNTDFVKDQFVSVDNPAYLSVKAIPKKYREIAAEKNILTLKSKNRWTPKIENQILGLLDLESEHDENLLSQFILFTKKLDLLRNQSIFDVIPEYKELFS